MRTILLAFLLVPALCPAQTVNPQGGPQRAPQNPDSIRARRERMIERAREEYEHKVFTHADTLRGTNGPERTWWDIQRYDITVKPDYLTKTTAGNDLITYKVVGSNQHAMQIDLQAPLHIDSIFGDGHRPLSFTQEGNAWHVHTPRQKMGSINTVDVFFSGTPTEGKRPPWSGGWTWTKDSLGRPWMTVTCQGLGASVWYPCKDYQGDEPDKGASMTMIVPDTLVAVSNGRMQYKKDNGDGTATYKWAVVNPISNYCLIPYIGKYVTFHEDFQGEKGHLDLDYWVWIITCEGQRTICPNRCIICSTRTNTGWAPIRFTRTVTNSSMSNIPAWSTKAPSPMATTMRSVIGDATAAAPASG